MSRKGENIYKRKDNRWEARYIKGYHPDGSAKFGYCYGKSYREAKRKLTEAKTSLISGKPVSTATKKRRIAFYCDEWLRLQRVPWFWSLLSCTLLRCLDHRAWAGSWLYATAPV